MRRIQHAFMSKLIACRQRSSSGSSTGESGSRERRQESTNFPEWPVDTETGLWKNPTKHVIETCLEMVAHVVSDRNIMIYDTGLVSVLDVQSHACTRVLNVLSDMY